jgi:YHS domain-containing protein
MLILANLRTGILPSSMLLAASALFLFAGCTRDISRSPGDSSDASVTVPSSASSQQPTATNAGEHAHVPGAHGGTIIPIGSDSYHAEAVVESNGTFRLLMLGQDESRIQEVELQALKAYVKGDGDSESVAIDLNATPQEGDAEGKTSQFTAQLPDNYVGKSVEMTIPNLRINGERFRVGFSTAATAAHSPSEHMPEPMATTGADDKDLYLTPGGKYTAKDIEANGSFTAAQKFKGIRSTHDMSPVAGDLICPITATKANPKFTWTIDGKEYQFCCPPCVDEFLKLAKQDPDAIKEPSEYTKK